MNREDEILEQWNNPKRIDGQPWRVMEPGSFDWLVRVARAARMVLTAIDEEQEARETVAAYGLPDLDERELRTLLSETPQTQEKNPNK